MKVSLKAIGIVLSGFVASEAYAGDAAMLIFKSGQVVKIDDGFRQISEALKRGQDAEGKSAVVELNLGSGTFLLNVAEVAVACRDDCSGITVMHQLDPKRGGYNTKIGIDQSRIEISPRRGPPVP
jgi:hypothetical protein